MAEADRSLESYATLDALFTRELRSGIRPIRSDWIHPVDGVLTANGRIRTNQAFQVKGWTYSISKLLGEQRYAFDNGAFLTYYLCPTDYHRVHSPVNGEIVSVRRLEGQLWPVSDWSVRRIRDLFCLNERVVINYHTDHGPVSVVMVGALNVGQISVACDPALITNRQRVGEPYFRSFSPPKPVQAGDEIGIFHMGSTVVVLASEEFVRNYQELPRQTVRLGEPVPGR